MGRSISLRVGSGVSKAQARPNVSLDEDVNLSPSAAPCCLPAARLPAMMILTP